MKVSCCPCILPACTQYEGASQHAYEGAVFIVKHFDQGYSLRRHPAQHEDFTQWDWQDVHDAAVASAAAQPATDGGTLPLADPPAAGAALPAAVLGAQAQAGSAGVDATAATTPAAVLDAQAQAQPSAATAAESMPTCFQARPKVGTVPHMVAT